MFIYDRIRLTLKVPRKMKIDSIDYATSKKPFFNILIGLSKCVDNITHTKIENFREKKR